MVHNLGKTSRYHYNQIKNRNTASVSLYTDGHVIAVQLNGKEEDTYISYIYMLFIHGRFARNYYPH